MRIVVTVNRESCFSGDCDGQFPECWRPDERKEVGSDTSKWLRSGQIAPAIGPVASAVAGEMRVGAVLLENEIRKGIAGNLACELHSRAFFARDRDSSAHAFGTRHGDQDVVLGGRGRAFGFD